MEFVQSLIEKCLRAETEFGKFNMNVSDDPKIFFFEKNTFLSWLRILEYDLVLLAVSPYWEALTRHESEIRRRILSTFIGLRRRDPFLARAATNYGGLVKQDETSFSFVRSSTAFGLCSRFYANVAVPFRALITNTHPFNIMSPASTLELYESHSQLLCRKEDMDRYLFFHQNFCKYRYEYTTDLRQSAPVDDFSRVSEAIYNRAFKQGAAYYDPETVLQACVVLQAMCLCEVPSSPETERYLTRWGRIRDRAEALIQVMCRYQFLFLPVYFLNSPLFLLIF